MLSVPIWMLYEIGLLFARYIVKPEEEQTEADGDNELETVSAADKP
jgi:Sec-independent protein secretion pathway component TatC